MEYTCHSLITLIRVFTLCHSSQVPRYDAVRFTQKLCQKCTSRQGNSAAFFDWAMLGRETGTCFNAVPSRVQFMAGPLGADFCPKERKQRAKRQKVESDSEAEEERPEEVKNQETNADQLSAVERNIEVVRKTLKKQSKRAYDKAFAEISALPEDEQAGCEKEGKGNCRGIVCDSLHVQPQVLYANCGKCLSFLLLGKKGRSQDLCSRWHTQGGCHSQKAEQDCATFQTGSRFSHHERLEEALQGLPRDQVGYCSSYG